MPRIITLGDVQAGSTITHRLMLDGELLEDFVFPYQDIDARTPLWAYIDTLSYDTVNKIVEIQYVENGDTKMLTIYANQIDANGWVEPTHVQWLWQDEAKGGT